MSAFYHDSAAALIDDGKIIAAVQEERFTRKKHDAGFPTNSIHYILKETENKFDNIDFVVFYEKPFLKFERLLETYVANAPRGFKSFKTAIPIWLKEKLFQKSNILKELKNFSDNFKAEKLLFSEHHESHAASAFYPSPFQNSVILTLDGVGEWATTTTSLGTDNNIEIMKEIHFPHSIGLLYSAFTYYLGFKVNSGEYKVMGLAPYGQPKYSKIIFDNLVDVKDDGSFWLNQEFFDYSTGLTMTNNKFSNLFKNKVRYSDSEQLTQFHMDIAASIQKVTEEIVLKITKNLSKEYKSPNLCLAGGVALNCVANGKILESNQFKDIWVQPASGDAGGALGAALLVWYKKLKNKRLPSKTDQMRGSFLGPEFSNKNIERFLNKLGAKFYFMDDELLINNTAKYLKDGKAIGWFQGRMEFGPRSLGNRSIIADARNENMQKNLNLKIKYRESFRPFAPAVTREDLNEWFELDKDSPYMLLVSKVNKNIINKTKEDPSFFGIDRLNINRSKIPAVTHVDYSARIQTVHKNTNPKFHSLICKFKEITNCPVLVNTSFNVRGEPIVCNPIDAFKCFMGTDLDILVVGNFLLLKNEQNKELVENYKDKYELD